MIKDSISKQEFSNAKLPRLKGHVKITLRDAETGHIDKVVEGDNIVSNAIRDLFAHNVLGGLNYSSLMPLYQTWFGGILCYKEFHPTDIETGALDPDDYFPKSDENNKLTAHAGNIAPSDIADDTRRGSPNTNLTVIKEHSIKLGWEWGTTQGNGQISAISLTHKDTGNAGLGSTSSAFASFQPLANIGMLSNGNAGVYTSNTTMIQYDENHALTYYLQGYASGATAASSNKLNVYIRKLAYNKAGLFDNTAPYELSNTIGTVMFTATLSRTYNLMPCYWFDYENKKLWIFSNCASVNRSNGYITFYINKVFYDIIPCPSSYDEDTEYAVGDFTIYNSTLYKCTSATSGEFDISDWTDDFTLEHGTINTEQSSKDLSPISSDYAGISTSRDYDDPCFFNIPRVGNYFVFPTTSSSGTASGDDVIGTHYWSDSNNINGLRKINANNHSDQSKITFDSTMARWDGSLVGGSDFIVRSGKVINGNNGYACYQDSNFLVQTARTRCCNLYNQPNKISSYVIPLGGRTATSLPRWIVANKLVNTTLFNLTDPETGDPMTITKQGTQAMTIEYTITEIPEEPAPEEEEE